MIFGYLILGNLVLAILNDAYARVALDVDERGYHWMAEYQKALAGSVSKQVRDQLDGKAPDPKLQGKMNHID